MTLKITGSLRCVPYAIAVAVKLLSSQTSI